MKRFMYNLFSEGYIGRMGLAFSILGLTITILSIKDLKSKKEDSFSQHIENIDQMSKNLTVFQNFISEQKQNLLAEQTAIENLKKERETMELLVNSDKKAVKALFIEQEKRQHKSVWLERTFGFFIGTLSSLIASFIFKKVISRKKNRTQQETNDRNASR
jgi:regulatory protein YycI of two-component signal transduction system YycFG